jgi:hypothetical protein
LAHRMASPRAESLYSDPSRPTRTVRNIGTDSPSTEKVEVVDHAV